MTQCHRASGLFSVRLKEKYNVIKKFDCDLMYIFFLSAPKTDLSFVSISSLQQAAITYNFHNTTDHVVEPTV